MKWVVLLLSILLTACQHRSDEASAPVIKGLFSIWYADSAPVSLDLRQAVLGQTMPMVFTYNTGATCTCSVFASGDQNYGAYVVAGCAYSGGGTGDPGCAGLNESGNYIKGSVTLSFCPNTSTCVRYH
jgi:hypothetical protein